VRNLSKYLLTGLNKYRRIMYKNKKIAPYHGVLLADQSHKRLLCVSNITVEYDLEDGQEASINGDIFSNGFFYRVELGRYKSERAAMRTMEKLITFFKENPDGVFDMRECR